MRMRLYHPCHVGSVHLRFGTQEDNLGRSRSQQTHQLTFGGVIIHPTHKGDRQRRRNRLKLLT